MWEFVDQFVCIHFDARTDRGAIMAKFFQEGRIPPEKITQFPAIYHTVGAVGATKSHISVLELAKRRGWKNVVILEDDIQWIDPIDTLYPQFETIQFQSWDVCMLGGGYLEIKPPNRITTAISAYSYMVRSHYYDTLLSNFREGLRRRLDKPGRQPPFISFAYSEAVRTDGKYALDIFWIRLQRQDTWIGLDVCQHVPTFSDVGQTDSMVDSNNIFTLATYSKNTEHREYMLKWINNWNVLQ